MPEYDLGFAAKLAETAALLDEREPYNYDARRVMVYLSRLSMEITLKALLEKAGSPLSTIKSRNHNLTALLQDLDDCEIQVESSEGLAQRESASVVRSVKIDLGMVQLPIGDFIATSHPDLSKYPNQIRYGATVIDFQPTFLVSTAELLAQWAKKHWKTIHRPQGAA